MKILLGSKTAGTERYPSPQVCDLFAASGKNQMLSDTDIDLLAVLSGLALQINIGL